jgi:hypothetical protein
VTSTKPEHAISRSRSWTQLPVVAAANSVSWTITATKPQPVIRNSPSPPDMRSSQAHPQRKVRSAPARAEDPGQHDPQTIVHCLVGHLGYNDVSGAELRRSVSKVRSVVVERLARARCSGKLSVSLGNRPCTARTVDRDRGPAAAVLIADVDEQRVVVVLDPDAMTGVVALAQGSGLAPGPQCGRQE